MKTKLKWVACYLLLTIVNFNSISSQEDVSSNRFQFSSISFSTFPLEYAFADGGMMSTTLDIGFAVRKNLFSIALNGATGIFSTSAHQFNLMYGRELDLGNRFSTELHIGLGRFSRVRLNRRESSLGIPLMLKVKHTFRKKFSMGFRITGNKNSVEDLITFGVLFQWDFLK
ncbi:hypothetical protein AAON49_13275 [Pseudotenacibaculum sp. MALMAid0570]|uniref:hypothetical protein n=1 Tax=Pseudotenacibaculum sp. MALMAid0570 TaxID=3143938 RepID=UPI0032DFBA9A